MRLLGTINPLPVARHLVEIRRVDAMPLARQLDRQAALLRRVVRHAADSVPWYRERLTAQQARAVRGPGDLAGLPVLDRESVRANRHENWLFAEGFGPHNTRSHTTSGSSGVPIVMHNSERDLGYLRATYLNDMLATGLRPTDRMAYFRPGTFLHHPLERLGLLPMIHVDTRQGIDEQVDAFLAGRPTFLTGFPNTIASIAEEIDRRGLRYDRVRRIVFGGERLTPHLRRRVSEVFGARCLEVYSAVEVFTIARTCPLGRMHLRPADVVVEVEHDDGSVSVADGEGEILLTRLRSQAMPLLRYRLGDRVRIAPSTCECGTSTAPVVEEVLGRAQDLLYGPDGRGACIDVINMPLLAFPELSRVQVVQEAPGVVEVRAVLAPQAPQDVLARMGHVVAQALPAFRTTVVRVEAIEPGPNGKIQVVRSASGWEPGTEPAAPSRQGPSLTSDRITRRTP
ncbi:MAG: phenylacetate--CoA ligase family protein [Kineosporiaceae bacterium]|nr:phenylacetate--CoA ligase family protein [Kineosporiaceae bacterium]